jgi:hypothetical protein
VSERLPDKTYLDKTSAKFFFLRLFNPQQMRGSIFVLPIVGRVYCVYFDELQQIHLA